MPHEPSYLGARPSQGGERGTRDSLPRDGLSELQRLSQVSADMAAIHPLQRPQIPFGIVLVCPTMLLSV